jgi:hypothetical protein
MDKTINVGDEITSTPTTECEECPEKIVKVRFLTEKWRDLHTLMSRMEGKEYAAYLLGYVQDDGVPYVVDYYIPEQEVNAVEADILEVVMPAELQELRIGWLHSHHAMGAFHSGRDEMSMNYPLNIVISTTGYIATYRHNATCGRIMRSKVEIVLVDIDRPIPGEEKIKQKTFVYQPPKFPLVSDEGWDGWKDGYNQYVQEEQHQDREINHTKRTYAREMRKRAKSLLKVGMQ